ncbi:MAG: hypothetical protein ACREJM_13080 [Candidatus Saccharimonadales bacterium]
MNTVGNGSWPTILRISHLSAGDVFRSGERACFRGVKADDGEPRLFNNREDARP